MCCLRGQIERQALWSIHLRGMQKFLQEECPEELNIYVSCQQKLSHWPAPSKSMPILSAEEVLESGDAAGRWIYISFLCCNARFRYHAVAIAYAMLCIGFVPMAVIQCFCARQNLCGRAWVVQCRGKSRLGERTSTEFGLEVLITN